MNTKLSVALALATGLSLIPATAATPRPAADYSQNPIASDEYFSNHSMGCMMLRECTAGVVEVKSIQDLKDYYGEYDDVPVEFQSLVNVLNEVGSKVYLAPERYFLSNTRGVYHTVSNNFYLNDRYMSKPHQLMAVMRHEGWHAAQDCMAGTIDNTYIAVILHDEDIPELWKDMARDVYPEESVPWEQEATWAGREPNMTLKALKACANDKPMWDQYDPTPLTRQFLVDRGYIK